MQELFGHAAWCAKVENYLDRLQEIVDTLNRLLEEFGPPNPADGSGRIEAAALKLAESVAEMEMMVAERESLLCDQDAPTFGVSLVKKLRSSLEFESHDLAARCDHISKILADSHHRAVSSFVCQFHLAELSGEIVGILSGASMSTTYGPQGMPVENHGADARYGSRGGLFNEAG